MRPACLRQTRRYPVAQQIYSIRCHSSTPGPLEARRRASRRKYVGTTLSQTNPLTSDLVALHPFELSTPSKWPIQLSQSNEQGLGLADRGARRIFVFINAVLTDPDVHLPSWLTKALNKGNPGSIVDEHPNEVSVAEARFKSSLGFCRSLQSVRELAALCQISLQAPRVSRLAFAHICSMDRPIPILLDFIADRSMNPPAAFNLGHMLQSLPELLKLDGQTQPELMKTASEFSMRISCEIKLGNITECEIRDLLRWTIAANRTGRPVLRLFRAKTIQGVAAGILRSKIRPLNQLQPRTVRCLVRACSNPSYVNMRKRHFDLAATIIRGAGHENQNSVSILIGIFLKTFLRQNDNTSKFKGLYRILRNIAGDQIPSLLPRVLDFADLGANASQQQRRWWKYFLLQRAVFDRIPLDIWRQKLKLLQLEVDVPISNLHPRVARAYLDILRPQEHCRFLFDCWILPKLKERTGHPSTSQLRDAAADWSNVQVTNDTLSYYKKLLEVSSKFSRMLATELASMLVQIFWRDSVEIMFSICTHCQMHGIVLSHTTMTSVVNRLSSQYPSQSLSLFMENSSLRLEQCLPLVAAIVASPSISDEVILPLLTRTASFRQDSVPRILPTQKRLAFVHALALMLSASNSKISSKLALLSRVLDMFELHLNSLSRHLVRAMVRGEVISPLRCGEVLSPVAQGKVLARVTKAEGEAVSKRLQALLSCWQTMNSSQ